jgi:hypothetical protein
MTSKFEQLIEFVINDEEAKAKELFHDIVVEKSREIYENLMDEEVQELDEESDAERDNHAEKAGKKVAKDIEYDEKMDEGMDAIGGDASDDLIDDVEAEEQGMMEEDDEESDVEFDDTAEKDGEELTHDMENDNDGADIEDRVVDLEDKLDELMAEFESLMGDNGDSVSDMDGGDALEMDDTDTADFSDEEMGMMEAINLAKAPAPVTSEPAGTNTKSTVTANSGARGAMAHPVKMTGDTAEGRPAPKTGELIGKVQNSVGGNKTMSPATKPVTTQASGVNTKSPVSKA